MIVQDVGVIGVGLWEGEVITNAHLDEERLRRMRVLDPYRGLPDGDGAVRVAGMELDPKRYARTARAVVESYQDPFRGTRRRRFFPRDLRVSDAETAAARQAIEDAGLTSADIDAVLVQSFLPDEIHPKNAARIAHNLSIERAPAWEVDSMCNSALTQMTIGASLITSGFAKRVLCVQSVAYSRVSDPSASASILEADMASALVLGPAPGAQMACSFRTDGRLHGAVKLAWAEPASASPRREWWESARERLLIRFDPALQRQVMGELEAHARLVCGEALEALTMRMEELDLFIGHQGMSWNSAFMADALGLPDGVAFDTFTEYANINAAGIPASIHEARRSGRLRRGSKLLLFGPGAGYTYAAVAMRW